MILLFFYQFEYSDIMFHHQERLRTGIPRWVKTCWLLVLIASTGVSGQRAHQHYKELQAFAEAQYGISDVLINGPLYFHAQYEADGHPYFRTQAYKPGIIYTEGKKFEEVRVNYNVEQDQMIFSFSKFEKPLKIILNEHFADSVRIGNHVFVKAAYLPVPEMFKGYYELIYRGDLVYFIKYRKDFMHLMRRDEDDQGYYTKLNAQRYLYKDGKLEKVNRRRSFITRFDNHRMDIRRFLWQNRIGYNKASSEELQQLIRFCEQLHQ